jgi:hypothetical protein
VVAESVDLIEMLHERGWILGPQDQAIDPLRIEHHP